MEVFNTTLDASNHHTRTPEHNIYFAVLFAQFVARKLGRTTDAVVVNEIKR